MRLCYAQLLRILYGINSWINWRPWLRRKFIMLRLRFAMRRDTLALALNKQTAFLCLPSSRSLHLRARECVVPRPGLRSVAGMAWQIIKFQVRIMKNEMIIIHFDCNEQNPVRIFILVAATTEASTAIFLSFISDSAVRWRRWQSNETVLIEPFYRNHLRPFNACKCQFASNTYTHTPHGTIVAHGIYLGNFVWKYSVPDARRQSKRNAFFRWSEAPLSSNWMQVSAKFSSRFARIFSARANVAVCEHAMWVQCLLDADKYFLFIMREREIVELKRAKMGAHFPSSGSTNAHFTSVETEREISVKRI